MNTPQPTSDLFEQRQEVMEVRGSADFLSLCAKAGAGKLVIRSLTVTGNGTYLARVTLNTGKPDSESPQS